VCKNVVKTGNIIDEREIQQIICIDAVPNLRACNVYPEHTQALSLHILCSRKFNDYGFIEVSSVSESLMSKTKYRLLNFMYWTHQYNFF
jgi:hypothetical protein